jgi:hypothetical protein
MSLQVFLISPDQIITYSLDDPSSNKSYIFNAELLTVIKNPNIKGFTEVSGYITPSFGVRPVVLGYENDKYELVYAPRGMGYVFKSDGKLAQHNRIPVNAKSGIIKVTDIDKVNLSVNSECLVEVNLPDPDLEDIKKYISMSQQGIEYNINTTFDELRKSQKVDPKPAPVLPSLSQQCEDKTPARTMKSPSPRITKPKTSTEAVTINKSSVTDQEIEKLKVEVAELRSILRAFIQRNYQLYPVDCPTSIRHENIYGPKVELSEIQEKMKKKEIERTVIEPLLQPYAGSHRGNNRMLTYYTKDGKICHVRAKYDPKTNSVNEPDK